MKLDLFAVCEGAFNSNGKLTIVNVYDYIRVASFPAKLSLGVGIKLGFEPGEDGGKMIVLTVVNQDKNQEVAKMEAKANVPKDDDEVKLNFASNVQGFTFPEEGRYGFKLSVDGNEMGESVIRIKKA